MRRGYFGVPTILVAMALLCVLAAIVLDVVVPGPVAAQEEDPNPPASSNTPPRPDRSPSGEVVPGQIIVKYEEDTTPAQEAALRRQEDLDKEEELDLLDAEVVQVEGRSTGAALRDLDRRPDVEYAEYDYVHHPSGYADEPRFGELWGLDQPSDRQGWQDIDVNGKEASTITQGDPNVIVAVIDTGMDFSHPDLADRAWKNPGESGGGKETNGVDDDGNGHVDDVNGWDFCRNDNTLLDPVVNPTGVYGHGTHIAGTIAASVNGQGVVGVAPNVQIMALKVCGPTSDVTQALAYAKSKDAEISNYSWAGAGYSQTLKDAIEASGQLFVAPAGNFSNNNDTNPQYPASYDSPNILSVAGINSYGNKPYSNYGATSVDISAPGEGILSSFPEIPDVPAAVLSGVGSSGGKALTTGFGADAIGDGSKRASFFTKAFAAVDRGSQQVILVDDDLSDSSGLPDAGTALSAAIQSATGSAPEVITVAEFSDGPDLSRLSGKTVVWATGWAQYSETTVCACDTLKRNLTDNDQQTLRTFLEGGGKLILTGQDSLTGMHNTSFVRDTLNLSVQSNSFLDKKVFEGSSSTAFAGESYNLNHEPFTSTTRSARHDVLIPTSSGTVAQGTYPGVPQGWRHLSGTSMAAAHATGVAALAASQDPSLLSSPANLKQIVMDGGKPLPSTVGLTVTGDLVNAEGVVLGVTSVTPNKTYGGTGSTNPTATFLHNMDPATLNTSTFTLTKEGTATPLEATVRYDSATKTATLDPNADLESNFVTYTAKIKGGPEGVKDATGNALVADKIWTFATVADTVKPSVVGTDPLAGATGVLRSTNVSVAFSEGINVSTLTTGNFTLTKQGSSTLVAATVNYDSNTKNATLDPSADLQASTIYTARVRGGSTGVKDLAGNALAQDSTWSFTTAAPPAPTCTITGTPHAETISGTAGDDVICAGGGNDTIRGLGGNDTLKGEAGNDTASYSDSLTAVSASLATNSSTGEGSDIFLGVEKLLGSSKADTLTGSDANNTLTGGGGNDTVVGGGGADTLKGSGGADAIDSKDGVSGNDSLDGGAGTDTKVTDTTEKSVVGFP